MKKKIYWFEGLFTTCFFLIIFVWTTLYLIRTKIIVVGLPIINRIWFVPLGISIISTAVIVLIIVVLHKFVLCNIILKPQLNRFFNIIKVLSGTYITYWTVVAMIATMMIL